MNSWAIHIHGWQPTRINEWEGKHWSTKSKVKKIDRVMVFAHSLSVPKATGKRRVRLVIELGHRQRGGDPDSYWKSLLDALVACKLLVDDNKEQVELMPVEYVRSPDKEKATRVYLYDVGEDS